MNSKELNHARGLIPALQRRAQSLREQAAYLDESKEGRSRMAARLREQADAAERAANELQAAVDAAVWFG